MISVYTKQTEINLGPRKIELLEKYTNIVNRGRKDPVWFIQNFLGVELTDFQKWIINSAWTKQTVCLVCSRNTGKSFIASLYIMARAILFPSSKIYIMSGTLKQAQDTFTKMEDIAKHNINSVKGGECIFANEVVRNQANTDGFLHDKQGYSTELYNGSTIVTLVGKAESVIGKRSNLSVYDEAAIISEEFFSRTEPFTAQSADFATGVDMGVYPKNLPNQNLYLSSAGTTNDRLYRVYKDCAKRMAMGFDDCFVADISCEIPLNPTINGKKYPPLFNRDEVDRMMRSNPYRGLREYYNLFDQMGGTDLVVSRDMVLRSEQEYLPVFSNQNEDSIYGIIFDPALQADNAFVLIPEYFKDPDRGWMMKIVNGINLLQTLPNGDKKPMRSTEQLEEIHNLMRRYNGKHEEYKKIHVMIDPGSGGGGRIHADYLIQEWKDEFGIWHHGIYDDNDETSKLESVKFPKAIPGVLSLPSAVKYKNEMFSALSEMAQEDLIIWPKSLSTNGKIEIDGAWVSLTTEEQRALLEIDLLKEEIWMMRKTKTEAGNVRYALQVDKQRTAHDDRAYTLSMAAWYLAKLRRAETFDIEVPKQDMSALLGSSNKNQGNSFNSFHKKQNLSPFAGRANPFARRR